MPLSDAILRILVCPENKTSLSMAEPSLVERLNKDIEQGKAKTRDGDLVKEKIDSGLVREDRKFLYPIRQDIPVMMVGEAIVIS